MDSARFETRRATLDDLPALRRMWERADQATCQLEKQLTDFQIAVTPDGVVLGCIGLQRAKQQGRLHHELYALAADDAEIQTALWERVLRVAKNHGLVRIWVHSTAEPTALERGFGAPSPEALRNMPENFGPSDGAWLVHSLRDESAERELELIHLAQVELAERNRQRIQRVRTAAGFVTLIILSIMILALVLLLKKLSL